MLGRDREIPTPGKRRPPRNATRISRAQRKKRTCGIMRAAVDGAKPRPPAPHRVRAAPRRRRAALGQRGVATMSGALIILRAPPPFFALIDNPIDNPRKNSNKLLFVTAKCIGMVRSA